MCSEYGRQSYRRPSESYKHRSDCTHQSSYALVYHDSIPSHNHPIPFGSSLKVAPGGYHLAQAHKTYRRLQPKSPPLLLSTHQWLKIYTRTMASETCTTMQLPIQAGHHPMRGKHSRLIPGYSFASRTIDGTQNHILSPASFRLLPSGWESL